MGNILFAMDMSDAERDTLRKRRAEIYSFFANARDKQAPGKAAELYEELTKINAALGECSTQDETICDDAEDEKPVYTPDTVNHPSHYTSGGIECIDAMKAMLGGYEQEQMQTRYYWHFLAGQVLKYLWRWPLKESPLQDLKKAYWYLGRLIDDVESRDINYTEKEISE